MPKTINLPVALYGYETCSLTLWEEHRVRCLTTGYRGKYMDVRERKWRGAGEDCKIPCQMLYDDQVKKDELCGICNTHGRDQKCVQNFSQKTSEEQTRGISKP